MITALILLRADERKGHRDRRLQPSGRNHCPTKTAQDQCPIV